MTQVELARRLNKPQSYVSKIEILERRIDVIELIDWLNVLETDISDFLTFCNVLNKRLRG
ncbi:helix-turn-helix family protein [Acinetobacter baumannii 1546444]|nr:helix-turn-helix family protein [Acinetobacter baumannii 1546444]